MTWPAPGELWRFKMSHRQTTALILSLDKRSHDTDRHMIKYVNESGEIKFGIVYRHDDKWSRVS